MLKDYLSRDIYNLITKSFSFEDITEIRLRVNEKIIICVKNKKYYLKDDNNNFLYCTPADVNNFIMRACDNSIYAYNNEIANGFLTLPKGVRVGICGNVVYEDDKPITIKEFSSINIRIPHFIKNCSLPAYDFLVNDNVLNTLIISPPGAGKTTFIRDFVYQLYQHNLSKNVLIADERNEICSVINSVAEINLGGFCDIYTNCSKKFAFKNGIRSMNPDVIITDELDLQNDLDYVTQAINSGVNVVATLHANDVKQLKLKPNFDYVLDNHIFDRYVFLSKDEDVGTLAYIYDSKLNCIYSR